MNFENQVAISTGAASGMGLLLSENWAAFGRIDLLANFAGGGSTMGRI